MQRTLLYICLKEINYTIVYLTKQARNANPLSTKQYKTIVPNQKKKKYKPSNY